MAIPPDHIEINGTEYAPVEKVSKVKPAALEAEDFHPEKIESVIRGFLSDQLRHDEPTQEVVIADVVNYLNAITNQLKTDIESRVHPDYTFSVNYDTAYFREDSIQVPKSESNGQARHIIDDQRRYGVDRLFGVYGVEVVLNGDPINVSFEVVFSKRDSRYNDDYRWSIITIGQVELLPNKSDDWKLSPAAREFKRKRAAPALQFVSSFLDTERLDVPYLALNKEHNKYVQEYIDRLQKQINLSTPKLLRTEAEA